MGEVFAGRYELVDPIAEGGMGSIWVVHDRKDDTYKAAKLLRQSDAGSLLRFMREQSMRIDHRHVVTPLSWAGEDGRVLFTMPLVRGGSVAELLQREGTLPLAWAVTLTDQLLEALGACHDVGILHRDVKPGNLLLEPTGQGRPHLRLTDFGIAMPMDAPRMTTAQMVMGSKGYMAPELVYGDDPAPSQDVYGAGVVALEMLTGRRPPYDDAFVASLMPPEPGWAGQAFLTIVRRMIDPVPARRFTSAHEARAAIASAGLLDLVPDRQLEIGDIVAALGEDRAFYEMSSDDVATSQLRARQSQRGVDPVAAAVTQSAYTHDRRTAEEERSAYPAGRAPRRLVVLAYLIAAVLCFAAVAGLVLTA